MVRTELVENKTHAGTILNCIYIKKKTHIRLTKKERKIQQHRPLKATRASRTIIVPELQNTVRVCTAIYSSPCPNCIMQFVSQLQYSVRVRTAICSACPNCNMQFVPELQHSVRVWTAIFRSCPNCNIQQFVYERFLVRVRTAIPYTAVGVYPVSYTHLTLPTNREV